MVTPPPTPEAPPPWDSCAAAQPSLQEALLPPSWCSGGRRPSLYTRRHPPFGSGRPKANIFRYLRSTIPGADSYRDISSLREAEEAPESIRGLYR